MFCTRCGLCLPDTAHFCTRCGAPVAPVYQQPAPVNRPVCNPAPQYQPAQQPAYYPPQGTPIYPPRPVHQRPVQQLVSPQTPAYQQAPVWPAVPEPVPAPIPEPVPTPDPTQYSPVPPYAESTE